MTPRAKTLLAGLLTACLIHQAGAAQGAWKTACYKRGFVGTLDAKSFSAETPVVRQAVSLPFDGSAVRVWLAPTHKSESTLGYLSLAPGVDREGGTDGRFYPVTFGGARGATVSHGQSPLASDEVAVPIRAGIWYLQQNYTGERYAYAYDANGNFRVESESATRPVADGFKRGSWAGNAYQVDVFTTDPRPVLMCYGDSITQGVGSTPNTGNRYPELLAGLVDRPVLNLGVNGDQSRYSRGISTILGRVSGVDTVIYLMGINDIIGGSLTSADEYADNLTKVIAAAKGAGCKFYLGTITPSVGYAKFDADPAKEELRQQVNHWIRGQTIADGVIDFDAALCDAADTRRLHADYQADWLHPNDAGYQAMAAAAARFLNSRP